jgi:hypothetical protein
LLAAAGCGSGGHEQFVPSAGTAREALQVALDAWKAGHAHGRIDGHKPPIEVLDSKWKGGQKLEGYEILSEDTNAEGHRRFTVRLTLAAPEEPQEARFIVLGLDPLWVYREEDYAKLSGM